MFSSRLNSAEQVAGLGYELTVIAAVVIGGTSLMGGEGGIFGTVSAYCSDRCIIQWADADQRQPLLSADCDGPHHCLCGIHRPGDKGRRR